MATDVTVLGAGNTGFAVAANLTLGAIRSVGDAPDLDLVHEFAADEIGILLVA